MNKYKDLKKIDLKDFIKDYLNKNKKKNNIFFKKFSSNYLFRNKTNNKYKKKNKIEKINNKFILKKNKTFKSNKSSLQKFILNNKNKSYKNPKIKIKLIASNSNYNNYYINDSNNKELNEITNINRIRNKDSQSKYQIRKIRRSFKLYFKSLIGWDSHIYDKYNNYLQRFSKIFKNKMSNNLNKCNKFSIELNLKNIKFYSLDYHFIYPEKVRSGVSKNISSRYKKVFEKLKHINRFIGVKKKRHNDYILFQNLKSNGKLLSKVYYKYNKIIYGKYNSSWIDIIDNLNLNKNIFLSNCNIGYYEIRNFKFRKIINLEFINNSNFYIKDDLLWIIEEFKIKIKKDLVFDHSNLF